MYDQYEEINDDAEQLGQVLGGMFDFIVKPFKAIMKSPIVGFAASALAVVIPPVGVPALVAQQAASKLIKAAEGKPPARGKPRPTPQQQQAALRAISTTKRLAPHSVQARAGFKLLQEMKRKIDSFGKFPLNFAGASPAKALAAAKRVVLAAKEGDAQARAAIAKTAVAAKTSAGSAAALKALTLASRTHKAQQKLIASHRLARPAKGRAKRGILVTETGSLVRGAFQAA